MIRLASAAFLISSSCIATDALAGEDEYEWQSTLIHSDVPLYTFAWDDLWPRSFTAPDAIAGCESHVQFGDWYFSPNPGDSYGDKSWYRFSNYGAFHCAANIRIAGERDGLGEGDFSRGFFVRIGKGKKDGSQWELWVLQQGMIPGSEYLLLARPLGTGEAVRQFTVLQSRCPKDSVREAANMDIWSTRYCAINSRGELLWLAKRMLREPPLGTLQLAENEKGPEADASDPSEHSD